MDGEMEMQVNVAWVRQTTEAKLRWRSWKELCHPMSFVEKDPLNHVSECWFGVLPMASVRVTGTNSD